MSFKDTLLLDMPTNTFGGIAYDERIQTTVVKREIEGAGERLILEQPRDEGDEEAGKDYIVLDRDTQHALYLILKGRFED